MIIELEHLDGYGVDYGMCSLFSKYELYSNLVDALNNVRGNCYIRIYEKKNLL